MTEKYFQRFREQVIGINKQFESPYGVKNIVYADWTASGRLYKPIEDKLQKFIGPFVANTHTGTTITGRLMTEAYHLALKRIKKHVGAGDKDVIISSNSGMTGVVNKFQRILGLKVHERYQKLIKFGENERPLVLVSHMEHHSNQTSWIETTADVRVIQSTKDGLIDLNALEQILIENKDRELKIAAITSYSNVTGIGTPYHSIAGIMHKHGGYCFVDFACSAPYININMHPEKKDEYLDAIFFSPHKFLGGPGSTGILVFSADLYDNEVPDCPGGGTVEWTNPWGDHQYVDDIEQREDGGTPAFLQTMKVALAIKLKEQMGVENILKREEELLDIIWNELPSIPNVKILAGDSKDRLGVISFYIEGCHYNLAVQLLNDRYGIQTRGGCSCAGTYGHILLHVDIDTSRVITDKISHGDVSLKPGWVRMSIHPIMTDNEVRYILKAIREIGENYEEWGKDYVCDPETNEFSHVRCSDPTSEIVKDWFDTL